MPIRFEVDPAQRLVMATADEVVTQADLRDYLTSVLVHPDVRPGFRELADLRGVTRIEIPASAISDGISSAIKEIEREVQETRTAILVSDHNAAEVSRLYDLLRTAVPSTVRLFSDMDEAREWLGLARENPPAERRVVPRSTVQIAVLCGMEVEDRSAQIVNLSLSGALLSCPTIRPAIGAPVHIRWEPPGAQGPSELRGTVVRHADGGFAVRFQTVTAELLRILGDPF
jgi:hypothetical protein